MRIIRNAQFSKIPWDEKSVNKKRDNIFKGVFEHKKPEQQSEEKFNPPSLFNVETSWIPKNLRSTIVKLISEQVGESHNTISKIYGTNTKPIKEILSGPLEIFRITVNNLSHCVFGVDYGRTHPFVYFNTKPPSPFRNLNYEGITRDINVILAKDPDITFDKFIELILISTHALGDIVYSYATEVQS